MIFGHIANSIKPAMPTTGDLPVSLVLSFQKCVAVDLG